MSPLRFFPHRQNDLKKYLGAVRFCMGFMRGPNGNNLVPFGPVLSQSLFLGSATWPSKIFRGLNILYGPHAGTEREQSDPIRTHFESIILYLDRQNGPQKYLGARRLCMGHMRGPNNNNPIPFGPILNQFSVFSIWRCLAVSGSIWPYLAVSGST